MSTPQTAGCFWHQFGIIFFPQLHFFHRSPLSHKGCGSTAGRPLFVQAPPVQVFFQTSDPLVQSTAVPQRMMSSPRDPNPRCSLFSVWYPAPGSALACPERHDDAGLLDDEDGVSSASPKALSRLAATVKPLTSKRCGSPFISSREVVPFTGQALALNPVAELVLRCPKPLMPGSSNKK